MTLLPVEEAQRRLLAMAETLPPEQVLLESAVGRWTIGETCALRSQPATDLSAMDGYALRFADLPGPWTVIGESMAGKSFAGAIKAGQAVRIYTGAAVPAGADTIVIQEDVRRDDSSVTLIADGPCSQGQHVRHAGSDFAAGQCIIPLGTSLTPRHVALAALAGHGWLPLPRPPRIALISTGSELVPPGSPPGPDQLPASNGVMLKTMLAGLPATVEDKGIIADNLDSLTACFGTLEEYDIVVTTGGASVGDHDLVKPALENAGGSIDFWKIRMRPGKPLISGRLGNALFLGLPGNPVSAFVTATLFLLPLVRKMAGCPTPLPETGKAELGCNMPATGGRDDYIRGVFTGGQVVPLTMQDSAATLALSRANCLIRRAAQSPEALTGEMVEILPL